MALTRRDFLQASLATLAACAAPRTGAPGGSSPSSGAPSKILILGGTGFLGPALVEAARARGDVVTLFNRGKTNPGLFPDLPQLHGDRNESLAALEGRAWDAVVDTSGYFPKDVAASAAFSQRALRAPKVSSVIFSVFSSGIVATFAVSSIPGVDVSA